MTESTLRGVLGMSGGTLQRLFNVIIAVGYATFPHMKKSTVFSSILVTTFFTY